MLENVRSLLSSSEDVLNLEIQGSKSLFTHSTYRVKDLIDKIELAFQYTTHQNEREKLFGEGIDCQLLQLGSANWQKGRIKVCVQFIPEKESIAPISKLEEPIKFPLDEIRQTLNGANALSSSRSSEGIQ